MALADAAAPGAAVAPAAGGSCEAFVRPARPSWLRTSLLTLYGALACAVAFFVLVAQGLQHTIPEGKFEARDGTWVDLDSYDVVDYGPYPVCHPRHKEYQHEHANGTIEWKKISEAPASGPYGLGHPENAEWQAHSKVVMQQFAREHAWTWRGLQPSLHLMSLATLCVYTGAKHTVWLFTEAAESREETAVISSEQAYWAPVMTSFTLFGLFLVMKYLGTDWIKLALTCAVVGMCTISIGQNSNHLAGLLRNKPWAPMVRIPGCGPGPTAPELLGYSLGAALAAAYMMTKNWVVSNVLGLSFCFLGMKLIGIQSYKTGVIMLWGLFFYDVFWVFGSKPVFGSNVMVSVATGIEAPIKLLFPRQLDACGSLRFSMLGLGDIAVPGMFMALLAKWDAAKIGESASTSFVYLNAATIAYVISLVATLLAMQVFAAAQPALLYIVPAVVLTTAGLAVARGEFKQLWSYHIPDEAEAPAGAVSEEDKTK